MIRRRVSASIFRVSVGSYVRLGKVHVNAVTVE
jgi:hypothetical protein